MAKTPVKPPSDKIEKIAAKALPKGKATKPATKSIAIIGDVRHRIIPANGPAHSAKALDLSPHLLTPSQQFARFIPQILTHGHFLHLCAENRQDFCLAVDHDAVFTMSEKRDEVSFCSNPFPSF